MNEKEKFEIRNQLNRCIEIYGSGALYGDSILAQSALVELLIRFNDILQFLSSKKLRINFKDDVKGEGVSDVTVLVNKPRNAACHERTSGENNFSNSRFVYCKFLGGAKIQMPDGNLYGSDYPDDIAFFYGDKRIYLNRHIRRLLEEIEKILKEK